MTTGPAVFEIPIPVQYRDIDTLGHVNNAVYLAYMEVVRVAFARQVLGITSVSQYDFVVARIEIDYRRPVRIEDELRCAMWTERVGRTSFTIGYRMTVGGETVVEAKSVQVFIDLATGRPKPVPEWFTEKLGPYAP